MKLKNRLLALSALLLALILLSALPALGAEGEPGTEAVTRGEFLADLYAISGETAEARQDSFSDVPAKGDLAAAVRWAVAKGIVNGYGNGCFGPDDPMTREQMAAMLFRNALALGQTPRGEWTFPLGFRDAGEVSAWAQEAVEWAVMNRILSGTDAGLAPGEKTAGNAVSAALDRWQAFLTPAGESRGIMLLFTGDVHCGIDQGFGYAGLQAARDALAAQGYDVILADTGDSLTGEFIGAMTKGEALTALMNKLGYSVAIPGNHEFDYGMDRFLTLAEKADFPYVSCNFVREGAPVFAPYVLRELGGRKLAFVGVTTPETLVSSTPSNFRDETGRLVYGFLRDETGQAVYDAVQAAADGARAEGADLVVLLAHLGNQAKWRPWTYGDVITHTTGIDLVLDGHSHDMDLVSVKNAAGRSVPRSACGTKLEGIGWCFLSPAGALETGLWTWNREAPAPELLELDNELAGAVAEAAGALTDLLGRVVARTEEDLVIRDPEAVDLSGKHIRIIRSQETNLGDLCADAYRFRSGAEIAVANGGGIRTDIPAGDITLGDIHSVFPFGNFLCMVEVTGQQLLDALEWGAQSVPGENGGFLHVSGLSYEIHSYIPSSCTADINGMFSGVAGERRVKNVTVGGVPLDPEKTYTLAGHDYMLLSAGDGFSMFAGAPLLLDCVKLDSEMLIDYITETLGGVIGGEYADPYGQGRIVIVDEAPGES